MEVNLIPTAKFHVDTGTFWRKGCKCEWPIATKIDVVLRTDQEYRIPMNTVISDSDSGRVAQETSATAFVARHPIFNASNETIGYELLFRSNGQSNAAQHSDSSDATKAALCNTLFIIGFDRLTDGKIAFVNTPWRAWADDLIDVLPPERTVVTLLDTPNVDDAFIAASKQARRAGYQIALNDVTSFAEIEPLLPLVDMVKVNCATVHGERRREIYRALKQVDATIIATHVDTHEDRVACEALGATYFQGFYYCQPTILEGRKLSSNEANIMRLMKAINEPSPDFDFIDGVIRCDATLSFQFLRYLNSAAMGIRNRVTSIKQGLALLGVKPLRKWVSLLALTHLGGDQNRELLLTCVIRARVCELLAAGERLEEAQLDCFLLGLLSGFDAVMGMTLADFLPQAGVQPHICAVLLEEPDAQKNLSQLYQVTLACERGDWGRVMELSIGLQQSQPDIAVVYYQALDWASDVMGELK